MAILKLYAENPKDGTSTFSHVEFYEANDGNGSGATLLSTEAIDVTNLSPIDPGFTSYTHTSGSTAKYYATKYKNSSGNTTDYSDWVLGGQDRWDEMFKQELADTAEAVWSSTDRAYFKEKALEALFPELQRIVIDNSLTIDKTAGAEEYTYSIPSGVVEIFEVGVGDVDNVDSTFKIVVSDNWKVEQNKLHFLSLASIDDALPIRLVVSKKFLEVGEVPSKYDPLVMNHLRMSAYIRLADDFPRFKEWAKLQQGTKVSFENLRVHAREFERKFKDDLAKKAEVLMASLT